MSLKENETLLSKSYHDHGAISIPFKDFVLQKSLSNISMSYDNCYPPGIRYIGTKLSMLKKLKYNKLLLGLRHEYVNGFEIETPISNLFNLKKAHNDFASIYKQLSMIKEYK